MPAGGGRSGGSAVTVPINSKKSDHGMSTVIRRALLAATAGAALVGCVHLGVQERSAEQAAVPEPSLGGAIGGPAPEHLLPPILFTTHAPRPIDQRLEQALGVVTVPDLWDRIREGFALPWAAHPRVRSEFDYFSGHPGYMQRVAERARPFLHHIVEECVHVGTGELDANGLERSLDQRPPAGAAMDFSLRARE